MRPPVFISGPYRGSAREVLRNARRACELGYHAMRSGLTPYVPHAHGFLTVFGIPERDGPIVDEQALDCCLAMVHHLADAPGAQLWVILRDDGTLSPGCQLEVEAWDGAEPICRTWAAWKAEIAGQEAAPPKRARARRKAS